MPSFTCRIYDARSMIFQFFLLRSPPTSHLNYSPRIHTQFDSFLWCIGKIGKSGGYTDGVASIRCDKHMRMQSDASIRYLFQSPPGVPTWKKLQNDRTRPFLFSKTRILRLLLIYFRECGVCMARRTAWGTKWMFNFIFFSGPNVKRINKKRLFEDVYLFVGRR